MVWEGKKCFPKRLGESKCWECGRVIQTLIAVFREEQRGSGSSAFLY